MSDTKEPGQLLAAQEAIAREERRGLTFMVVGRLVVLALLALWVLLSVSQERSGLYLGIIAAFAVLGTLPYVLAMTGRAGFLAIAILLTLEAAVLSYILVVPMPFNIDSWTPQLNLRLPGFLYLGLFLVSTGLSYSPVIVIWAGIAAILSWSVGYVWVANLPTSILMWPLDLLNEQVTAQEFIDRYLDPSVIRPNFFVNQIAFLSAVTVVLALTVWRSRVLVHRVLAAEREREVALEDQRFVRDTFGKFVPSAVVSQILSDRGQLAPKERLATVLFADLVGFTALSKRLPPDLLLRVLNEYFEGAGAIITDNGGTITQFQGDALLASFNVPMDDKDHAFHAIKAAQELMRMVETRDFLGERLGIRIGINTGNVVAGAVGGTDRLTYTIHGECVNVAARLEQLNKETGTVVLIAADTAAMVGDRVTTVFIGSFDIRGTSDPIDLYCLDQTARF